MRLFIIAAKMTVTMDAAVTMATAVEIRAADGTADVPGVKPEDVPGEKLAEKLAAAAVIVTVTVIVAVIVTVIAAVTAIVTVMTMPLWMTVMLLAIQERLSFKSIKNVLRELSPLDAMTKQVPTENVQLPLRLLNAIKSELGSLLFCLQPTL